MNSMGLGAQVANLPLQSGIAPDLVYDVWYTNEGRLV